MVLLDSFVAQAAWEIPGGDNYSDLAKPRLFFLTTFENKFRMPERARATFMWRFRMKRRLLLAILPILTSGPAFAEWVLLDSTDGAMGRSTRMET